MLVVIERDDEVTSRACATCPTSTCCVDQLNAYDVLVSDDIVFTKAALDAFIAGEGQGAKEEVSA